MVRSVVRLKPDTTDDARATASNATRSGGRHASCHAAPASTAPPPANPAQTEMTSTGGRDTVGLRVPDHPVALALLDAYDCGIAAPSANRFGKVSPTTAAHVVADPLGGRH